jgi:hypothetical protein
MKRNKKLSDAQIATIGYLRRQRVPTIIIARTLQMLQGVALSTTYYHVDKLEVVERVTKKAIIVELLQKDYNTLQIAERLNMTLAEVNKIYTR